MAVGARFALTDLDQRPDQGAHHLLDEGVGPSLDPDHPVRAANLELVQVPLTGVASASGSRPKEVKSCSPRRCPAASFIASTSSPPRCDQVVPARKGSGVEPSRIA